MGTVTIAVDITESAQKNGKVLLNFEGWHEGMEDVSPHVQRVAEVLENILQDAVNALKNANINQGNFNHKE